MVAILSEIPTVTVLDIICSECVWKLNDCKERECKMDAVRVKNTRSQLRVRLFLGMLAPARDRLFAEVKIKVGS